MATLLVTKKNTMVDCFIDTHFGFSKETNVLTKTQYAKEINPATVASFFNEKEAEAFVVDVVEVCWQVRAVSLSADLLKTTSTKGVCPNSKILP